MPVWKTVPPVLEGTLFEQTNHIPQVSFRTSANAALNLIDEMKTKIDTEQGKRIYARRLGNREPVFANICVQKRMNRFTLRTKLKVDVQWRLFALVHNIGKIHTFGAIH